MFLIERIIGIIVFIFTLFVFSSLISKCKSIKQTKKILIAYIIVLFITGYFYLPYYTADLYYIKNLISSSLVKKDFSEIILMFQNQRYQIYYIYYWIFGKIGNISLLPATTAAIFYSNVFYILYKSSIKYEISTFSNSTV